MHVGKTRAMLAIALCAFVTRSEGPDGPPSVTPS
jgi:hypothetical protein